MITTRKIAAVALLGLSFVAAAAAMHGTAPANDTKVFVTAEQQPSGETMTVVTVVGKRLNAKEKLVSAFQDARDATVAAKHG
ncbi:MAG TPA: hypothetical protein VEC06_03070 [Paucimonas sp.]|nr:hypothetical protein [Paucimonas sp.]